MGRKYKPATEVGFLQKMNQKWRACAKGKEGRETMPLQDAQTEALEALADISKAREGAADTDVAQRLAMKRKNKLLMQGYAYFCVDQHCSGYMYQSTQGQGKRKLPNTEQYVYTQARFFEIKSRSAQHPSPSPQKKNTQLQLQRAQRNIQNNSMCGNQIGCTAPV